MPVTTGEGKLTLKPLRVPVGRGITHTEGEGSLTLGVVSVVGFGDSYEKAFVEASSSWEHFNLARSPHVFSATGGSKTVEGLYTTHTFRRSGVFECLDDVIRAEVLVVAGGGGGSHGGGGGGGYLFRSVFLTGSMPVVVGIGGLGTQISWVDGENGGDSSFAGLLAVGGGGGGAYLGPGVAGGSGGGAGAYSETRGHVGGAGILGQGFAGGDVPQGAYTGAGGGGAASVGSSSIPRTSQYATSKPGNGGVGLVHVFTTSLPAVSAQGASFATAKRDLIASLSASSQGNCLAIAAVGAIPRFALSQGVSFSRAVVGLHAIRSAAAQGVSCAEIVTVGYSGGGGGGAQFPQVRRDDMGLLYSLASNNGLATHGGGLGYACGEIDETGLSAYGHDGGSGAPNSGGGGGGAVGGTYELNDGTQVYYVGGDGGSGIVIIHYLTPTNVPELGSSQWDVCKLAASTATTRYHVSNCLSRLRSASYNIFGLVSRTVSSLYDVSAEVLEVFKFFTAVWEVAKQVWTTPSSSYSIDRSIRIIVVPGVPIRAFPGVPGPVGGVDQIEDPVASGNWYWVDAFGELVTTAEEILVDQHILAQLTTELGTFDLNNGTTTFIRPGVKLPRNEQTFDEVRSGLTGDIRQVDIRSPLTSAVLPMMIRGTDTKTLKATIDALTAHVLVGGYLSYQDGTDSGSVPDPVTYVIGVSPAPEVSEDKLYRHKYIALIELNLIAMAP